MRVTQGLSGILVLASWGIAWKLSPVEGLEKLIGKLQDSTGKKVDDLESLLEKLQGATDNKADKPSVQTYLGSINGRRLEAPQGGYVDEYLGIPFAKSPVGDLRFANPEPLDSLPSDPYEADNYQNACTQISDTTFGDFVGSDMWNSKNPHREDCLYLNVWVPRTNTKNKQVAVWIFGGGFYSGSASLWVYDGKALAAHTDMIIVSFNYRVGSFGYFSTGDGRVKGNFGMMDQVMALQWVQDNIESFGGSKDNVAIFGESAGGASVSFHILSDLSNDLFARAWIESASSDSHWAWMSPKQAQERSAIYLKNLNCSDAPDILKCLRAIDAETILANEWVDGHFMVFPWAPTLDEEFMKEDPYTALRSGFIKFKDVVLGVNKNEGTFWILYAIDALSKDDPSPVTYEQFIDSIKLMDWDLAGEDKLDVLQEYSPPDVDDEYADRDALDDVCGDRSFTCPTVAEAKEFVKAGLNTYFYHFTHRASNEEWPEWMGVIHAAEIQVNSIGWYAGKADLETQERIDHFCYYPLLGPMYCLPMPKYIIQFIFGMPLNKSRGYSPEEVEFSKTIMDYLANFAKTGNPNGPDLPEWPRHDDGAQHLDIKGPSNFKTSHWPIKPDRCHFWDAVNKKYFTEIIN